MTPEQQTFLTSSPMLMWMFYSQKAFPRLNNTHARSLCRMYQDYISKFITLLVNANKKSIHKTCLEFLMIQIYKYLKGLSLQIINDILQLRKNTYNLRNIHLIDSQKPGKKGYRLDCIA